MVNKIYVCMSLVVSKDSINDQCALFMHYIIKSFVIFFIDRHLIETLTFDVFGFKNVDSRINTYTEYTNTLQ